ncbi:Fungal specific transcription factor domain-containing protein [Cladophialophora immunda]|nr:Fungal specific transcription factor domain-containing protein [Cladophialophora immunda]
MPISPRTMLDTSRWGSLNHFGQLGLSHEFQRIFDDALIHQWPAFALATHDAAITEIREAAIRTSLLAPHCLFATIYAGECYRSYFDGRTLHHEMLQLQLKQQALRHLRRALQDHGGVASDEVLWTITLLAIHGSVRTLKQPRFTVPVYRDNEFYSSVEFERTHLHALRTLVAQKGGLKALTLHGLSNMISMVDTFHSLMNLTKPVFPPLYPAPLLVDSLRETWDDVAKSRFANRQDGFIFLEAFRGGPRLHQIICQVRVLLETFSLCLRNPRRSPDIMLMVHTRRVLQHDALQVRSEGDCFFEVARLSFVVFMAELAWTLPVIGGFHEKVTKLLLEALEECVTRQYWQRYPEFLLWATVMGGLAARQGPRVSSFAAILRDSSMAIDKDSWAYVKSVSQKFLPLEYDLGDLCHDFWDEACDFLSEKTVELV